MNVARLVFVLVIAARLHAADVDGDALLRHAVELLDTNRLTEARAALEASLAAYRADGDEHGEGLALLVAGILDRSRIHLEQAQAILQSKGDYFATAMAVEANTRLDREEGRAAAAAARYERALAWLCEQESAPLDLDRILRLAKLAAVGDEMKAQPPELVKLTFLFGAERVIRTSYGESLTDAGRWREAETELYRAGRLSSLTGGSGMDDVAAAFGDLRWRQGRLEEARAAYLDALGFTGENDLAILRKLASVDLLRGEVDEALAWNAAALERARVLEYAGESLDLMIERGSILANGSRFAEAESVLHDALRLAEERQDLGRKGGALLTLGYARMLRSGDYGKAAAELDEAITIFRELGWRDDAAAALGIRAAIYARVGMAAAAGAAMNEAEKLAANGTNRTLGAVLRVMTTVQHMESGRARSTEKIKDALAALAEIPEAQGQAFTDRRMHTALLTMMGNGDPGDLASMPAAAVVGLGGPQNFQAMRGITLLSRGEVAAGRAALLKALEGEPGADLRVIVSMGLAWSSWLEGNAREATGHLAQAADSLEAVIDDLDSEDALISYLDSERRRLFDSLIELEVEQGCIEEAFVFSERARARAFLQMIGSGTTKTLREAGEYASLMTVTPGGATAIQRELPPATTMIAYFVTEQRLHVWALDRETMHHVAQPMDAARLKRIDCWARQFEKGGGDRGGLVDQPCAGAAATARDVFELLIEPIRDHIHHPRLILVPHDVLHYVPFAALQDSRGRYLIQDYTLLYAPSASSLGFLRAMETAVDGTALVLGDPPEAGLPGTAEEARQIAASFGVPAHVGDGACEGLVHDLGGRVDLLHLAAHGYYDSDDPLESYIALAPCEKHDGRLQARELLQDIDLRGVNLVVLSACRTAIGRRSGGDEIIGLTRAVLSAGSPGVISTLWRVDDQASAGLMIEFYTRLAAGRPAADALREAQLAMIEDPPELWAAFCLTGDPQARWTTH